MAIKRALVVDDSKTARQSLARLLAQHDLEVCFAVSGEAALEFLKEELVDVIFMDHTMPGMDGLEAVSAIKGNPRTATIPVMMYTTKEGEVYVSQARALGAVGVLPKQVQPGALFDMLLKLGLVTDRRTGASPPEGEPPRRRFTDIDNPTDREYEEKALGVSVQALVTRILEEQHLKLRADILASQRRFARQVARELRAEDESAPPIESAPAPPAPQRARRPVLLAAMTALMMTVGGLGAYAWQTTIDRDAARQQVARLSNLSEQERSVLNQQKTGLAAAMSAQQVDADRRRTAAVQALEWAMNLEGRIGFHQLPFDDTLAARLAELLPHLRSLDFSGEVVVGAQLGRFCLVRDDTGTLMPADPELSVFACEEVGHPLAGASVAELQSTEFAAQRTALERMTGIAIRLQPPRLAGDAAVPRGAARAVELNRRAAQLHRVEFRLEPRRSQKLKPTPRV